MKQGSIEFHEAADDIVARISDEGLRIARENHWQGVGIRVTHPAPGFPGTPRILRCQLVKTVGESEIDEPTTILLDAANELFGLFDATGSSLASMTMDWIKADDGKGVRRVTRYTYHD